MIKKTYFSVLIFPASENKSINKDLKKNWKFAQRAKLILYNFISAMCC